MPRHEESPHYDEREEGPVEAPSGSRAGTTGTTSNLAPWVVWALAQQPRAEA